MKKLFGLFAIGLLISCNAVIEQENLTSLTQDLNGIEGKTAYLASPYVTAGDRVYMVGHQDGTFPDLGWHIKGEMGGVWNHPIKLMDGFSVSISKGGEEVDLDKASRFINYPMAAQMEYELESLGLSVTRTQFVPDGKEGMVIQFEVSNRSGSDEIVVLNFEGMVDLRPTWLGERTDMNDDIDTLEYNSELDAWIGSDASNPWHVVYGANWPSTYENQPSVEDQGNSSYELILGKDGRSRITFVIAGSYTSKDSAIASYNDITKNHLQYFKDKEARYKQLASQSKLTIPDKDVELAFEWLKYNCDWLVRTVPEVGSGIGAGIPDYPWWFGVDSEYALQGYMAIGQRDPVYNTIQLLDSVSEALNGNGRIIHEMSTNGAVFNPGNINETPQFATLIWKIYQWNGDETFLRKYYPTIKKGLEWLMTEKDADGNLFPDGFGMMEIHGLNSEMIDVASYTQKAFADASKIAMELDDKDQAIAYDSTAKKLQSAINDRFWSEEFGSYADFIGTDKQALHLIEDAIVRADTLNKPWAVEELKATRDKILANPSPVARPFVLHHNWVVNTPMEVGIAYQDKAMVALETAKKYVNPFGVFVTGIDRDESAGSDDGSFKGSKVFSYTGAVMTLPTGVQVVSENNYGRPDEALNYIKRMTRTFSYAFPGSIYEVSPDYGMVTQAWNIYGYAVPIVEQFFGIQPDARNRKVIIDPQMPSTWETASLENVIVGDNAISISFDIKDGKQLVKIDQTADWNIVLRLPKSETSKVDGTKGSMGIMDVPELSYYEISSADPTIEVLYAK